MKKCPVIILVVFLMLVSVFLANGANISSVSDLVGKSVGMISPIASKDAVTIDVSRSLGGKPGELVFFNRVSDGITALMFGKIDAMAVSIISADFYMKRNPNLKSIKKGDRQEFLVVMALRTEDQELKDKINEAIETLKNNGELKKLQDEWVNNFPADKEPSAKKIPSIPGAKTYYVGVSGDLTPLDYIGVDGRPAGFNVALLSEISKILNVNFKFVSVENQARYAALCGRKIDIIFCNFKGNMDFVKDISSMNWISTEPYFSFDGVSYLVKK